MWHDTFSYLLKKKKQQFFSSHTMCIPRITFFLLIFVATLYPGMQYKYLYHLYPHMLPVIHVFLQFKGGKVYYGSQFQFILVRGYGSCLHHGEEREEWRSQLGFSLLLMFYHFLSLLWGKRSMQGKAYVHRNGYRCALLTWFLSLLKLTVKMTHHISTFVNSIAKYGPTITALYSELQKPYV